MEDTRSRQAPDDSLAQIASASPHMEDELLAERIEHDLGRRGSVAPAIRLSGLIGAIPLLRSRPIALDAAIDVVVRGMLARGESPQDIEAALLADSPEFADSIRAHMALRSMMSTTNSAAAPKDHQPMGALPVSFGPDLPNGKPRYELVENVGGGSEGRVYRAFDRQISTGDRPLQVAVKILHSSGDAVPARVIDEVARVMRVRHPAVVSLLNWERDYEQPFLVYEFIEGESLDRWRKTRARPSCREIAMLVRRLAEGVQAIHTAGVAHRDIKPNNIIIDRQGAAYITDFGLAEEIAARASLRSGGSLAFAAPEQLQGEPGSSGNAVDVYALGGVLYWLLTGNYPNGATTREVQQHVTSRLELPEVDRDRYGRSEQTLHQIARRALSPDPADRHSSADALAIDLGRLARPRTGGARSTIPCCARLRSRHDGLRPPWSRWRVCCWRRSSRCGPRGAPRRAARRVGLHHRAPTPPARARTTAEAARTGDPTHPGSVAADATVCPDREAVPEHRGRYIVAGDVQRTRVAQQRGRPLDAGCRCRIGRREDRPGLGHSRGSRSGRHARHRRERAVGVGAGLLADPRRTLRGSGEPRGPKHRQARAAGPGGRSLVDCRRRTPSDRPATRASGRRSGRF
ncbi:MAG: serine/threonine protein kinase [Planctomycetota bacterium]|nr:MAG: serine/threonine protein kinase [Planctomycetota bacterium]